MLSCELCIHKAIAIAQNLMTQLSLVYIKQLKICVQFACLFFCLCLYQQA